MFHLSPEEIYKVVRLGNQDLKFKLFRRTYENKGITAVRKLSCAVQLDVN